MEKTSELVKGISAASNEQNAGVNQVNNAVQQLNNVTQKNAASAEELSANAQELTKHSELLNEAIAYFKMNIGVNPKNLSKTNEVAFPQKRSIPRIEQTTKPSQISGKQKGAIIDLGKTDNFDNDFEQF
ncbi:MAG: hypothetical protein HC831_14745 [Chloroflexia bacterium]|nr:hypothetical protein [Chloroflexia bacterium]